MKAKIIIKLPSKELEEKYMNKKLTITLFGKDGVVEVVVEMKPLDEDGEERK